MVHRDSKNREKDLAATFAASSEVGLKRDLMEYLELRYDRMRDNLVGTGDDLTRGRAQELRDLRKIFDKRIDNATDAP